MNGSWHRYRPGERWRRPPAGPGSSSRSRARSRSASMPRSSSSSSSAPRRSTRRSGSSGRTCSAPDFDADEALRRLRDPERADARDRRGAARPARAGRDRQRLQERGALDRARLAVRAGRRPSTTRPSRRLVATARRLLLANATSTHGPERVTTAGDRGAPGPLYVYGRTGRPCRRCRTPIASRRQGVDPPRTTYWCPACQPEPAAARSAAAYHRAACVSTSSPGRRNRSGSTSCGRSPSGSSASGSPGSAGARRGSTPTARLASYRDVRAFRDDPGREAVGATETTSALVHLRRPSRLSTLTLPDTQPFDDPAGRFAFSHNGDLRDYKAPAGDLSRRRAGSTAGPTPRSAPAGSRTPGDPDEPRGAPARRAPRPVRRPGQPRGPDRRRRRRTTTPATARTRSSRSGSGGSASSRPASTRSTGRCSGSSPRRATDRRLVPLRTTASLDRDGRRLPRRVGWRDGGAVTRTAHGWTRWPPRLERPMTDATARRPRRPARTAARSTGSRTASSSGSRCTGSACRRSSPGSATSWPAASSSRASSTRPAPAGRCSSSRSAARSSRSSSSRRSARSRDYTISRWGRRKPYIFIGSLLDLVFLVGIAYSNTLIAIAAFIALLQFSSNFAQGPFQGYVPDLVPAPQVGTASALVGLMQVLGVVSGLRHRRRSRPPTHNYAIGLVALGVLELVTMLSVVFRVREGPVAQVARGPSVAVDRGRGVGHRHPRGAQLPVARRLAPRDPDGRRRS